MQRKVLPINNDPQIKTYTYHGFCHAIISANDKVDENVARINIVDFEKSKWKTQNSKLTYTINDNTIEFYGNKWNTGMNICFWRQCLEEDEIEIKIERQIYSNIWGAINIFVANSVAPLSA